MSTPAANRLYLALLTEMASGNYSAEQRFLSHRKIMKLWKVSATTANLALDMLVQSGVLAAVDRSGHYLPRMFLSKTLLALNEANKRQRIALTSMKSANWRTSVIAKSRNDAPLAQIAVIVIIGEEFVSPELPDEEALGKCIATLLTIRGVIEEAKLHDAVIRLHINGGTAEEEAACIKKVLSEKPQGVIIVRRVTSFQVAGLANTFLKHLIPVVTLFDDCENTDMISANFNNIGCGYNAATELIHKGHRNLGILLSDNFQQNIEDRRSGFATAARKYKPCKVTRITLKATPSSAARAVDRILKTGITAVFAVGAEMFSAIAPELKKRQIAIPANLSVIVCSSIPDMKDYPEPVDIVYLDFKMLGQRAFLALYEFFHGRTPQKYILTNPVIRPVGSIATL